LVYYYGKIFIGEVELGHLLLFIGETSLEATVTGRPNLDYVGPINIDPGGF